MLFHPFAGGQKPNSSAFLTFCSSSTFLSSGARSSNQNATVQSIPENTGLDILTEPNLFVECNKEKECSHATGTAGRGRSWLHLNSESFNVTQGILSSSVVGIHLSSFRQTGPSSCTPFHSVSQAATCLHWVFCIPLLCSTTLRTCAAQRGARTPHNANKQPSFSGHWGTLRLCLSQPKEHMVLHTLMPRTHQASRTLLTVIYPP